MTTLEIPGQPVAKARPRFNRKTGVAYTPKKSAQFEARVEAIAADHFTAPIDGPVSVKIFATFETPKSWSKKKTAALINRPHTQRPDLDNIQKAVLDGMNGVAFRDDSQVAEILTRKVWGPAGRTVVVVEGLTA